MDARRNISRKEESEEELSWLSASFEAWLAHRIANDPGSRHASQLRALAAVVTAAAAAVSEQLSAVDVHWPEGEVYDACRLADTRALFIRRLWWFYRDRWAGRDDPADAPLLACADELVWSCWAPIFRVAGSSGAPAPPLPYIDAAYSPYAVLRHRPPPQVRTHDELLQHTIAHLPVPLIAMPPVCDRRPWWLAILAHETGHHVEAELRAGGLAHDVADVVATAADRSVEHEGDWRRWSQEIFADAFGVSCVGSAHLWVLDELQLTTDHRMHEDEHALYPPRAQRRQINEELLCALEGEQRDGPIATMARRLVGEPLRGTLPLRELCGWRQKRFAKDGEVDLWAQELRSMRAPTPQGQAETPRFVVAGALRAWLRIRDEQEPARRSEERAYLRDRTFASLALCHEPGDRAEPVPVGEAGADLADDVARRLTTLQVHR